MAVGAYPDIALVVEGDERKSERPILLAEVIGRNDLQLVVKLEDARMGGRQPEVSRGIAGYELSAWRPAQLDSGGRRKGQAFRSVLPQENVLIREDQPLVGQLFDVGYPFSSANGQALHAQVSAMQIEGDQAIGLHQEVERRAGSRWCHGVCGLVARRDAFRTPIAHQ